MKADHLIELSSTGIEQAMEAGARLAALLPPAIAAGQVIAAYVSPYRRTRQTWEHAQAGIVRVLAGLPMMRQRKSIFLREIEFRLFDGIPDADLPTQFPLDYACYGKLKAAGGAFYARMPSGESRCDVAQRVHPCFGTIHRDHERHKVEHAIVVSHRVTIRTFTMMWLGLSPDWIEAEKTG